MSLSWPQSVAGGGSYQPQQYSDYPQPSQQFNEMSQGKYSFTQHYMQPTGVISVNPMIRSQGQRPATAQYTYQHGQMAGTQNHQVNQAMQTRQIRQPVHAHNPNTNSLVYVAQTQTMQPIQYQDGGSYASYDGEGHPKQGKSMWGLMEHQRPTHFAAPGWPILPQPAQYLDPTMSSHVSMMPAPYMNNPSVPPRFPTPHPQAPPTSQQQPPQQSKQPSKAIPIIDPNTGADILEDMNKTKEEEQEKKMNDKMIMCAEFQRRVVKTLEEEHSGEAVDEDDVQQYDDVETEEDRRSFSPYAPAACSTEEAVEEFDYAETNPEYVSSYTGDDEDAVDGDGYKFYQEEEESQVSVTTREPDPPDIQECQNEEIIADEEAKDDAYESDLEGLEEQNGEVDSGTEDSESIDGKAANQNRNRQAEIPIRPDDEEEPTTEEKFQEEEEDRIVKEKNDENRKLSLISSQSGEEDPERSRSIAALNLEETFKKPTGKWSYTRDYLLKFQSASFAQKKPDGLPDLLIVRSTPIPVSLSQPHQGSSNFMDQIASTPDLLPPYMNKQMHSGRRDMKQGPRFGSRGMDKQPPRVVIRIDKNVDLHTAENAWLPGRKQKEDNKSEDDKQTNELYKKVRSILNKLTPQKFESLVNQMDQMPINTQDRLQGVIDLVFDKAVEEPNYALAYAKMCSLLSKKDVPKKEDETKTVNFRKFLITKCQKEFEKDKLAELDKDTWLEKIENTEDEKKKEEIKVEFEEVEQKVRRRYLGNIRFIGELYKQTLLSHKIMHECIVKMLTRWDEDKLECLCKLLTTVGCTLEAEGKNKGTEGEKMNKYFSEIKSIIEHGQVSSRVRFMLQDIQDLRQNNWKPRREVAGPKTINQVHKDAEMEAAKEAVYLQNITTSSNRREEKRNKPRQMEGEDSQWTQVPQKRKPVVYDRHEKIDINKLPNIKGNLGSDIKLGPGSGMLNWNRGSQGGRQGQDSERLTGGANRYLMLAPESMPPKTPGQGSRTGSQTKDGSRGKMKPSYSQERATPRSFQERKPRGSASSSRESSLSREAMNLKGGPELDEDEAKSKTTVILDEFLSNLIIDEACECVAEKFSASNVWMFVYNFFTYMLERSVKDRNKASELLCCALEKQLISRSSLQKGLTPILEFTDDFIIDIPKFFEYIGEILVLSLHKERISMKFLRDLGKCCIESGRGAEFLGDNLKVVSDILGSARLIELWTFSGCDFKEFLGSTDQRQFLQKYKLEYLGGDDSCSDDPVSSLVNILRITPSCTKPHEDCAACSTVQQFLGSNSEDKPAEIRLLIKGVCNYCANCVSPGNMEEYRKVFKEKAASLLKTVIKKDSELEVQCIYGVQNYLTSTEHPQGLASVLFECLYDDDIVSEDSFYNWRERDDDCQGKPVVVSATNHFFVWLKEAEEEDVDDDSSAR